MCGALFFIWGENFITNYLFTFTTEHDNQALHELYCFLSISISISIGSMVIFMWDFCYLHFFEIFRKLQNIMRRFLWRKKCFDHMLCIVHVVDDADIIKMKKKTLEHHFPYLILCIGYLVTRSLLILFEKKNPLHLMWLSHLEELSVKNFIKI